MNSCCGVCGRSLNIIRSKPTECFHYTGILDGKLQNDICVCSLCKEKMNLEEINFDILIEESKVL